MMINRITIENLKRIDQGTLLDPTFFTKVEDFVYEIEAEGSPDMAREIFLSVSATLNKSDESAIKKYLPILCALRLISLISVSDNEKKIFLGDNIITLLNQNYVNVKFWLKFVFSAYAAEDETQQDLQKLFVSSLSESSALISEKNIQITTGQVRPLVKNWIYDYNAYVPLNKERSASDETAYINQSPNTKLLTPDQRNLLLKLLRIYDWLRFDVLVPKKIIEDLQEAASERPILTARVNRVEKIETPIPPQPQSAFDQKISQASASAHGLDLEALKHRVEETEIRNQRSEIKDQTTIPKNSITLTPDEIKREVSAPELAAPTGSFSKEIASSQAPRNDRVGVVPPPPAVMKPVAPINASASGLRSLNDIKTIEDLKKITVMFLRQGPLQNQISNIKNQILRLAAANNLLPYYAVVVFEQSPLFQAYLKKGSSKMIDQKSDIDLSQEEFEAIADLRKEIERL